MRELANHEHIGYLLCWLDSPCLEIFGTFFFTHSFSLSLVLCSSCTLLCNYMKQTTGHCLKTINLIKTIKLIFLGSTSDEKSIKKTWNKTMSRKKEKFWCDLRHAFRSWYLCNAKTALNLGEKYPLLCFPELSCKSSPCLVLRTRRWDGKATKINWPKPGYALSAENN